MTHQKVLQLQSSSVLKTDGGDETMIVEPDVDASSAGVVYVESVELRQDSLGSFSPAWNGHHQHVHYGMFVLKSKRLGNFYRC